LKTNLWIVLLIIVSIASFILGATTGIYQFELYDSPYKAFLAAALLEKLEKQNITFIKLVQESKLTDEIVKYGECLNYDKYLGYVIPWLIWPYSSHQMSDLLGPSLPREEFIKKAINYRRIHPIEYPYDVSICAGDNKDEEFCEYVLRKKKYYDNAMQSVQ